MLKSNKMKQKFTKIQLSLFYVGQVFLGIVSALVDIPSEILLEKTDPAFASRCQLQKASG